MIKMEGKRFGRLEVISFYGVNQKCKRTFLCRCDCGAFSVVIGESLRSGNTQSCGCKQRDAVISKNKSSATRDGLSNTPTGKSWGAMLRRCYCKKDTAYAKYVAVGITVCEFLRATPANLISLIGERPEDQSIDRKDNLDGYHCGKCAECLEKEWKPNIRWATDTQQTRNQRSNHILEFNGEKHCLSEWAEITGLPNSTIQRRIRDGWSVERLLTQPKLR